jgi:type IV secretory pathway protease TraF
VAVAVRRALALRRLDAQALRRLLDRGLHRDNRSQSHDSRAFGPVPLASVQGRAVALWFPLDRVGSLVPNADPS